MTLSSAMSLAGVSSSQFGPGAQIAFAGAVASTHSLPATSVIVTSRTDSAAGRRRRLHQATSLRVAFIMLVPTSQQAAVSASSAAVAANPAAFTATLNAALASAPDYTGPTLSAAALSMEALTALAPPPPPAPMSAAAAAAATTAEAAAANMLSSTPTLNSSAVNGVVTAALSSLTASDLSAAQASLLVAVASLDVSANTAASASLVLTVLSVGGGATSLSAGTQRAALSALSSIASATINATDSTVKSVADALTLVSAAGDAADNAMVVIQVSNVQTSLLTGLASQNSTANPAAFATAVAAMVAVPTPGVALSTAAINATLSVLVSVVSTVPASSGQTVADALSNITTSAQVSQATSPAALTIVTSVMSSLQTAQVASLLGSSNSSVTPVSVLLSSPNINSSVLLVPPSAASAALAVPGSSFAPLPAAVLPAGIPLVVQFLALSFSPYNASASSSVATSVGGMTRLVLTSTNGTTIPVSNTVSPIMFNTSAASRVPGSKAACVWWDNTDGAFSARGCTAVPNPAPANHTLGFIPGYQTPTDATLAGAWSITGPLFDATCQLQLVDCTADAPCTGTVWGRNCSVYPNPRLPLGPDNAAVTCPVCPGPSCPLTGPPVLRVAYGAGCALWQNNTLGCWWNNTNQTFVGPGCVSTSGPAQCMCRHLTDFAAARAPSLSTVSTAELLGLSAADIITKLRLLFIVVITLFGIMLLGAAVGSVQDWHHRNSVLAKLMLQQHGFTEQKSGAWTWTLRQDPLVESVGTPSGSAVRIADVFAFPFIRLRCAMPKELLPGSIAQSLGRRSGLSALGLRDTKEEHDRLFSALRRRQHVAHKIPSPQPDATDGRTDGIAYTSEESVVLNLSTLHDELRVHLQVLSGEVQLPTRRLLVADYDAWEGGPQARASGPDDYELLVSTALVFAFVASRHILPQDELAKRRKAASDFFTGVSVPGIAHDFDSLCRHFSLMLGFDTGSMAFSVKWLDNARLWRLILLQQPDGSWDLGESLAFAARAHAGPLPRRGARAMCMKFLQCARPDAEFASDTTTDENAATSAGARMDSGLDIDIKSGISAEWGRGGAERVAAAVDTTDCPLTFSLRELRARMPPGLLDMAEGERLWATALACGALEGMNRSWLLDDERGKERTILDAGRA